MYGRIAALAGSKPSHYSGVLAAVGCNLVRGCTEIIQLRRIARRLDPGSELDVALAAVSAGNSAVTTTRLAVLDRVLASLPGAGTGAQAALRARGRGSRSVRSAHPTCFVFRRGSARVRFTEINPFGRTPSRSRRWASIS